jgi:hypothetical protein
MIDQYNQSVVNQGIPPEEMRAVCCDLTAAPDQLDGMKFDVVVVSLPAGCDAPCLLESSVRRRTTISLLLKMLPRPLHHT